MWRRMTKTFVGGPRCNCFACLVQVPLSCDLGQVVKQLAHLGCWDGLLDLPLRRAAAVDPEVAARLPGEAGRAAREVRPTHALREIAIQKY